MFYARRNHVQKDYLYMGEFSKPGTDRNMLDQAALHTTHGALPKYTGCIYAECYDTLPVSFALVRFVSELCLRKLRTRSAAALSQQNARLRGLRAAAVGCMDTMRWQRGRSLNGMPKSQDSRVSLLMVPMSWIATLRAASCASSSLTSCPTLLVKRGKVELKDGC